MTNLLKNAAESIEGRGGEQPGHINVTMGCKDHKITIEIVDNGTGFQGDLQKLFEPYVTTRSKGTGLGLSIVKKIVEDHKGQINIANIEGGGAKVVLSFLQHCDI
jgi:two-component system nitrogen regulation sensor histidine kinase NtrY